MILGSLRKKMMFSFMGFQSGSAPAALAVMMWRVSPTLMEYWPRHRQTRTMRIRAAVRPAIHADMGVLPARVDPAGRLCSASLMI